MDTEEQTAQADEVPEMDQETLPAEDSENQDQETDEEKSEESEKEEGTEEEGSQPKKEDLTKNMQKRLAKEKSRQYALEAELEKERADKAALQEQMNAQKPIAPDAPIEPHPDDFDLGREDKGFIAADRAFNRYETKREILTEINQNNQQNIQSQQAKERAVILKEATDDHYERAGNIQVDDYLAVEKRAMNILGKDVAEAIFMDFDASQDLLYHLGENTDKAREVSRMFKDGKPVKGLRFLTRLEEEVRVKKKTKKFAPDPEGEEESGKPPSTSSMQSRGPKGATYQ